MQGWSQALLKRLAAAIRISTGVGAIAGAGGAAVASELGGIPIEAASSLIQSSELSALECGDRERLLNALSMDGRPKVRRSVAMALGYFPIRPGQNSDQPHRRLACDPVDTVRGAMGWSLRTSLGIMASADRTALVVDWTTDRDPQIRLAIARALHAPFDAIGVTTALACLVEDSDPGVRLVADRAAAVRAQRRFAS